MTAPDLDGLLHRFTSWGAAPTVDGYLDLFAEDGTLFDSGMAAPLTGDEIGRAIVSTLAMLGDFRLEALHTARSHDTLVVEARNRAILAGTATTWDAVYCMTAAGSRVRRGRRYWDQAPVFELLTGPYPAERPHPDAGPTELRPTTVLLGTDGPDDPAWYREWTGTVAPQGTPVRFDAMEAQRPDGTTRWFANTLTLRPAAQATVRELQARLTGPADGA